jgi:hypothetical protein
MFCKSRSKKLEDNWQVTDLLEALKHFDRRPYRYLVRRLVIKNKSQFVVELLINQVIFPF